MPHAASAEPASTEVPPSGDEAPEDVAPDEDASAKDAPDEETPEEAAPEDEAPDEAVVVPEDEPGGVPEDDAPDEPMTLPDDAPDDPVACTDDAPESGTSVEPPQAAPTSPIPNDPAATKVSQRKERERVAVFAHSKVIKAEERSLTGMLPLRQKQKTSVNIELLFPAMTLLRVLYV